MNRRRFAANADTSFPQKYITAIRDISVMNEIIKIPGNIEQSKSPRVNRIVYNALDNAQWGEGTYTVHITLYI